jgi:anti-sigma regulatory factor (Ser/Thr protein kinase)
VTAPPWDERPPPRVSGRLLTGSVSVPADLTTLRGSLRQEVLRRGLPENAHEDDLDRLLLSFEELTSNGLRHGRRPVWVTVTQDRDGWLIDVTDAALEQWPEPAVDRDPAHGGMGLLLVATLSSARGWWIDRGRKHVWAHLRAAA